VSVENTREDVSDTLALHCLFERSTGEQQRLRWDFTQ